MLPGEVKLVERLKDQPFALIGLNSDEEDRDVLRKKFAEKKITWRNGMLGNPMHPLPSLWNVRGWPTLFVIDQEGKIRYKGHSGEEAKEEIFKILKITR